MGLIPKDLNKQQKLKAKEVVLKKIINTNNIATKLPKIPSLYKAKVLSIIQV